MQPLTSQDLPTMATAERNHQTIFWRPPSAAKLFFHQPTPQRPRSLTALTDSHQFAAANDAGGDDLHISRSYLSREDVGRRWPEHRGFPNILIYIKSNRLTGVQKEGGNRETGRLQGGGNAPWLENHAAWFRSTPVNIPENPCSKALSQIGTNNV